MVFKNDFVVAVKVNGKVLSEQGNIVRLPFGSEYSVLLKNMRNERAVANVTVDWRKVVDGIIVPGNDSVELERFVDSMDSGYKLKFIEKTDSIEKHRGNKVEDGILRVEYRFEKPRYQWVDWTINPIYRHTDHPWDKPIGGLRSNDYPNSPYLGSNSVNNTVGSSISFSNQNDNGITAEGEDSHQQFSPGYVSELEYNSTVITLQLKGYTQNDPISRPMYVRQKITCIYCGKRNDNRNKFCGECGARLKTF